MSGSSQLQGKWGALFTPVGEGRALSYVLRTLQRSSVSAWNGAVLATAWLEVSFSGTLYTFQLPQHNSHTINSLLIDKLDVFKLFKSTKISTLNQAAFELLMCARPFWIDRTK